MNLCLNTSAGPCRAGTVFQDNPVEIIYADLDTPATQSIGSGISLSHEESQRADTYLKPQDRLRFVGRRRLLRHCLSQSLHLPPQNICLRYSHDGKPFIWIPESDQPFYISTSHSDNLAVIALSSQCQIGIDIEKIQLLPEYLSLAERYFTREETKYINNLDVNAGMEAFYTCWTRKEAYLKAAGIRPLHSFDTGLATNQLTDFGCPKENGRWSIHSPKCPGNWKVSLITESPQNSPVIVSARWFC